MKTKGYHGDYPCPGCGKSGTEIFRTSKYALCNHCKSMIELGESVKESDDKFAKIEYNPHNVAHYGFSDSRNNNHYIKTKSVPYISSFGAKNENSLEKVNKSLHRLLQSQHFANTDYEFKLSSDYPAESVTVTTEFADAFKDLMNSLGEYFEELKKVSFEEGGSLLKSLTVGKITLSDFEEKVNR